MSEILSFLFVVFFMKLMEQYLMDICIFFMWVIVWVLVMIYNSFGMGVGGDYYIFGWVIIIVFGFIVLKLQKMRSECLNFLFVVLMNLMEQYLMQIVCIFCMLVIVGDCMIVGSDL